MCQTQNNKKRVKNKRYWTEYTNTSLILVYKSNRMTTIYVKLQFIRRSQ